MTALLSTALILLFIAPMRSVQWELITVWLSWVAILKIEKKASSALSSLWGNKFNACNGEKKAAL